VLKWPDAKTVARAVRQWAREIGPLKPETVRIGYFGSYARGDWGVGSDLDLVIIVDEAKERVERRASEWDATRLPVPAEALVYTVEEWNRLAANSPFGKTVSREAVWVYERGAQPL